MYCQHCGKELLNGAKFCTNCGAPVNSAPVAYPQYGKLSLTRTRSGPGIALKAAVIVDGEKKCDISYGNTVHIDLPVGQHVLSIRMSGKELGTTVITISPAAPCDCSFDLNAWGNLASFSLPYSTLPVVGAGAVRSASPATEPIKLTRGAKNICPRCGGNMTVQTVTEDRRTGCLTVLLYILLIIASFGLALIFLLLRRKTRAVTYMVCQSCGYKRRA